MVSFLFNEINLKHLSPGFKSIRVGFGQGVLRGGGGGGLFAGGSERLLSHFINPELGTVPPRCPPPCPAGAEDLPTPIHMQKNSKAEGLLDLISCCAFGKIRIMPSAP